MGADRDVEGSSIGLVEDLFRNEHAHLVAALTRTLGPSNLPLAEDVVQDALVSAMHAWRFGPPRDPKAWIVRAARNRAVDVIRRERRAAGLGAAGALPAVQRGLPRQQPPRARASLPVHRRAAPDRVAA